MEIVDPELYELHRCTLLAKQFEICNAFFWPRAAVSNNASILVLEELAVNWTSTVLVGMRSLRILLQVDRPAFGPGGITTLEVLME